MIFVLKYYILKLMKSDTLRGQVFTYPFSAIVGQEKLKLALLLNAVDPGLGGVLIKGERGTGKSTAARALAELLPPIEVVADCPFYCSPHAVDEMCEGCRERWLKGETLPTAWRPARLVNLPLNATVDRLVGSFALERALKEGVREFEPGILAEANRSILYVDEVNLLEDHIVDLLLDVAATGVNHVEREGITFSHPSRFIMIGTMNPEEGDLRPQLEDRFGLCVEVKAERDPRLRVEIMRRRHRFRENPQLFLDEYQPAQEDLRRRIERAREILPHVSADDEILHLVASISSELEIPGHRGDIALLQAARAKAALEGSQEVGPGHVAETAEMVFLHRVRKSPLDSPETCAERIARVVDHLTRAFEGKRTHSGITRPTPDTGEGPLGQDHAANPSGGACECQGPGETTRGPQPSGLEVGGGAGRQDGSDSRVNRPESHAGTSGAVNRGQIAPGPDLPRFDGPDSPGIGSRSQRASDDSRPERDGEVSCPSFPGGALPRLSTSPSPRGNGGKRSEARDENGRGIVIGSRPYLPGEKPDQSNLHLDSTLKASVLRRGAGEILPLAKEDLRRSVKKDRAGNLIIFLVDASASMRASDRIECARKAILDLLVDAYQKRDRVGLVTFRDRQAQLVLAPTSSVQLARLCVREIATGGSTPLCHGLELAYQVIKREKRRDPSLSPILAILTDGFGNVPYRSEDPQRDLADMAGEIKREGISCVVFDTLEIHPPGSMRSFRSPSRRLADILGASYFRINSYSPDEVTGSLRSLLNGVPA